MSSKAVLPLGVAVAVALSLLVLLGVAFERWLLATAAVCALLSASLLVCLDTWRRVRSLRTFVRDEVRRAAARQATAASSAQPAAREAPEVDAVLLLQAQYVGRLDRLQAGLEALVEHASAERGDGGLSASDQHVRDGVAVEDDP